MTEPSKAARERRDKLYEAVGWPDNWSLADVHAHAFALYIDETQAFRQEVSDAVEHYLDQWQNGTPGRGVFQCQFASFIIPQPDPDEELAREVAGMLRALPLHGDAGCDKLHDDEWRTVAIATIKRLREQGRLKDA